MNKVLTVENVLKATALVISMYVLLNRLEVRLEGIDDRLHRIEGIIDRQVSFGSRQP